MPLLTHHFLENSADRFPDREAVVHGSDRCTYTDIESRANQIANWLLEEDLRKGDRVALLLRNSSLYVSSYYGILKAGGVAVPLNTGIGANEIGEILVDCSPKIVISEQFFRERIEEIGRDDSTPWKVCVFMDWASSGVEAGKGINSWAPIGKSSSRRPSLLIGEEDLSSIVYTSGSTGRPKGVVLTHANICANTLSIVSYLGLSGVDRCMVVLPFYYVYGKSLLNTHFAVGGSIIIDNRFAFPNAVLKTMIAERATGFAGVPSTYTILAKRSSAAKMSFPALRYITQAGGHLPSEIKKALPEIFKGKEIYIMYGATEASARLSYLDPRDFQRKMHSIGKPIRGVEMKVVKDDGKEEGEIAVKGPNIMKGYWDDPEETEKVLKSGWYYTGDLGYVDDEGFFFLTGRRRDLIKVGIHKVSAIEIEEVLYRYPGVREAAVIGVPDEASGEAVKAIVVMENGACVSKSLLEYCSRNLPVYKVPKEIVFAEELPKNEAGKVLKQRLAELYCGNSCLRCESTGSLRRAQVGTESFFYTLEAK